MGCIFNVRNITKVVFSLIVLLLGFFISVYPVHSNSATQGDCLRLTEEFDLLEFEDQTTGKQKGVLDAGDGVTLVLSPSKTRKHENRLTFQDHGRKIDTLRMEGLFSACFRLEAGDIKYWVVEGWDRGAHCCFSHLYFCRPGEGYPVRVLDGVFLRHSQAVGGGVMYLSKAAIKSAIKSMEEKPSSIIDNPPSNLTEKQIICLKSQSYIQYLDNRFAYGMNDFETSYAGSTVMFFPIFFRLSSKGLKLSNESFKENYLQRIACLDKVIRDVGANGPHFTATKGYVRFYAADDLWILITARTINYLLAREDSLAWETLRRDVQQYYGTTKGLGKLKKQIKATMAEGTY